MKKMGFSNYLVLVKRTAKPLDDKLAEKIISRKLESVSSEIGVKIITSIYTHGSYDWILSLRAKNIIQVKKIIEQLKSIYTEYIEEVILLETLFFVKKQGFKNPNIKNFKKFI